MAVCNRCGKEMSDASVTTCEGNDSVTYPDGKALPTVPYDPGRLHLPKWFRCPDCNVVPGGRHHSNCDQEYCPNCGGQLISCDCFDAV
ncbi:MAG: hypothetical protein GXX84_12940 [Acidobacteria bacterium]|nr:hypothetical protein [Acidobacteriota bacterium]